MKLLNLACGGTRIVDETWVNIDNLHAILHSGTPERENLDREFNYVNCDLETGYGLFGFQPDAFDGILASHCFEHWDCQTGVKIMQGCHRLLVRGGVLMVSVPDAAIFRAQHHEDTVENAERLFGEPIHLPDGEVTFANYCLWNRYHKAILTEDALWAYFLRAGFKASQIETHRRHGGITIGRPESFRTMQSLLNRPVFSLVMSAEKT